jgi:hypothetical protein
MINFREVAVGRKVMAYFKGYSKPEVDKAVQDYLKEYPYAGYMTEIEKEGENMDGGYYAHLLRLGSCD